jgi:hypothetical protein
LELVDQARFQVTNRLAITFIHEKELDAPVTEMVVLGETALLFAQAKPYLDIAARHSRISKNARKPKRSLAYPIRRALPWRLKGLWEV